MAEGTRLEDFRFDYPEELVAARPAEPRDSARLMVLDRASGRLEHRVFRDLPDLLAPGDCLVVNRSKVLPARLKGRKPTGGKVELLLVEELKPGLWAALSSDLKPGREVLLPGGARASVERLDERGRWLLRFPHPAVADVLRRHGEAPLPPYILKARKSGAPGTAPEDLARYQTVYAREEGSIAAPTAGLHFTPEVLRRLEARGVRRAELVLHVGMGTFRPVTADDVLEHRMLPERYEIPEEAAGLLERARREGGRIVAVGTTAVRTLETWARGGRLSGETSLYVRPGHEFKAVDALVTNFHLPESTPLILAGAFAGRERLLAAYREAFARRYRLFSYGDAMLVL